MDRKLLHRFFEGSATDKDISRIRAWVELSSENEKELMRERKIFDAINLLVEPAKNDNIKAMPRQKTVFRLQIPQIAAMIAIVFLSGMFTHKYLSPEKKPPITSWYETIAPLGAKSQVTLIDGTKIWLNAGSRLLYSTDFGQQNREVQLEGEAYFEVAKNVALPFEVVTSDLKVKAIGTTFNVKAYPGESTIETILVEGEVEVTSVNKNRTKQDEIVVMQPEQRLTLEIQTGAMVIEKKSQQQEQKKVVEQRIIPPDKKITPKITTIETTTNLLINTSWKEKRWRIESEELGVFATKLERRFNVSIVFEDNNLSKYKFNGAFEDEPLEEILRALALAAPVKFALKGNRVTLSRNNKFNEDHKSLYEQQL